LDYYNDGLAASRPTTLNTRIQMNNDKELRSGGILEALKAWFAGAHKDASIDRRPGVDLAEELTKLQRGLRRISLANDRNTELLGGLGQGFQELNQAVLKLGVTKSEAQLSDAQLLDCLDRLDKVLDGSGIADAVRDSLRSVQRILVDAAGWRIVAVVGGSPDGVHLRVVETLAEAGPHLAEEPVGFRIHTVLQQGYLRADGSRVRPAVVVAAGRTLTSGSAIPALRDVDPGGPAGANAPEY
jgi:hypothetical protein